MIVNWAPTGMVPTRKDEAPLQPDEIADEAARFGGQYDIIHVHARDEDDKPTWEPQYYARIINRLRGLPVDICVSTSGREWQEIEKRSAVLDLNPDSATLTMGSWDYMGGVNQNPLHVARELLEIMLRKAIKPEFEVFDLGHINYMLWLIHKYEIENPRINLILGGIGTAQPDLLTVGTMLSKLPMDATVCIGGIGRNQRRACMLGMMYAEGVRIGMEDNPRESHDNQFKWLENALGAVDGLLK